MAWEREKAMITIGTQNGQRTINVEVKSRWVILFASEDGSMNDWEYFEGTFTEAAACATCDGQHINYGRNGYRIIPG